MIPRKAISSLWTEHLATDGTVSVGLDVATTEKGTSNPSAISVQQKCGRMVFTRLLMSFKTSDPLVTEQMLGCVLDDLMILSIRPRRLVIDNSNEKFFATNLRKNLGSRVPVELVSGNQKLSFRGEELDAKTLLGNLYVSALEDGFLTLPGDEWIVTDHRLVFREAGGFTTNVGSDGGHGDTFDAGKLAYWGLQSGGGPVRAEAVRVGNYGASDPLRNRPGVIGPIGRMTGRQQWSLAT